MNAQLFGSHASKINLLILQSADCNITCILLKLMIIIIIIVIILLTGRCGYELIYITNEAVVIISSYPASPRRITVLVNFQAILFIFSGETSSNRDFFFTDDVAKKFFPTSKILA